MFVSVYLSNDEIQAVTGSFSKNKITVESAYSSNLTGGCMISGVIIDKDELTSCIEKFWEEYSLPRKNVSLVIGSSQWISKQLSLPDTSKRNLAALVDRELSDDDRMSDPVYDYMLLDKTKSEGGGSTLSIMASKAERRFVKDFIALFDSLGIKVSSIDTARNCQIKLLGLLPCLRDKTSIIQFVDGNTVFSALWVNGKFAYSSRSRLINDQFSEDFPEEITRNINSIVQFQASQLREHPINQVYLCGVSERPKQLCHEAISSIGLQPGELQADGVVTMSVPGVQFYDFTAVIGSAVKIEKSVNFCTVVQKRSILSEKTASLLKTITPIVVVIAMCMIATAVVLTNMSNKEQRLEDLKLAITDSSLQEVYDELNVVNNTRNTYSAMAIAAEQALEAISSYPKFTSSVVSVIESCGEKMSQVTITGYTASTGALEITAQAAKAEDISEFVENLQNSGLFNSVEYSGYSIRSDSDIYDIKMTVSLLPPRGEGHE